MPTNEKIIAVWGSPHAGKTAFAVRQYGAEPTAYSLA